MMDKICVGMLLFACLVLILGCFKCLLIPLIWFAILLALVIYLIDK